MSDSSSGSRFPRPNVYGWIVLVCLVGGTVVLTAGSSSLVGGGLLALGALVLWIAMRQNDDETEASGSADDGEGPSDNQKKAQAQADASGLM